MQMNLGNENILNDSEAESSAFQWQNRLPYFALEKISPHRTLWPCSWAAFGMQANLDRSTTRYTTKAHCYTDKLKHLTLCKLLSNKKMPVTKSSWLLNQNWRLSPFFPWLTCPNSERKTTQETSYIHKTGVLHAFSPHKINTMWTWFSLYILKI